MISKRAETAAPIHDLLAERWSPRAFQSDAVMSDRELVSLLEAARWAASGSNVQPSRFIVARRGESAFEVMAATLAGFNAVWAPNASALILGLHEINDVNGKPRMSAMFDLGLAIGNLCTQATADGWHTHPIGGFDREKIREAFNIDQNLRPTVIIAVGRQGEPDSLPEELANRERAARTRLDLDQLVLVGLPDGF